MSYQRFARRDRYAHERDDDENSGGGRGLDAQRHSRDARRTMESQIPLRTDEPNAGYRYQYEFEQASYLEIYSHNPGQALAPATGNQGLDWRLHPLSLTVGTEIARQFHWKAETGTIYTYEHELSSRYIHLDRITRQFCDQQRNPLSADRALAHAMPQPDEVFSSPAAQPEPAAAQPPASHSLAVQAFAEQPFGGQSLVGQWKAASALRERSELSVGSFVRRADYEAQESHQRFTASAVRFLQQEMPPGTGALVRIYRKLTMKASQVHSIEPTARQMPAQQAQSPQVQSPQVQSPQIQSPQSQAAQAFPARAPQLYAESAPLASRPVQQAGELNVAAFTRRAA